MILFGVDMFERRVEFHDGAIDGVVPESASNVVYGSLQLLQFLSCSSSSKSLSCLGVLRNQSQPVPLLRSGYAAIAHAQQFIAVSTQFAGKAIGHPISFLLLIRTSLSLH